MFFCGFLREYVTLQCEIHCLCYQQPKHWATVVMQNPSVESYLWHLLELCLWLCRPYSTARSLRTEHIVPLHPPSTALNLKWQWPGGLWCHLSKKECYNAKAVYNHVNVASCRQQSSWTRFDGSCCKCPHHSVTAWTSLSYYIVVQSVCLRPWHPREWHNAVDRAPRPGGRRDGGWCLGAAPLWMQRRGDAHTHIHTYTLLSHACPACWTRVRYWRTSAQRHVILHGPVITSTTLALVKNMTHIPTMQQFLFRRPWRAVRHQARQGLQRFAEDSVHELGTRAWRGTGPACPVTTAERHVFCQVGEGGLHMSVQKNADRSKL